MVVMLGFVDQEIKRHDLVDWSTNKIGGFPNLIDVLNSRKQPHCKLCSQLLYHLTQIYCPLQNSDYHRILNVFGCVNKECWNQPESIVVLRSQLKVEVPLEEKKPIDQDDWGVNDWSNGSMSNDDWGLSGKECEYIHIQNGCLEESTPMDEIVSQIDELSVESTGSEDGSLFTDYHIYVQTEDDLHRNHVDSKDYEMRLYQDYISREGDINCAATLNHKKNQKDVENYEKTQVKHGDELFHQFKKRISNYPEQLIRYEWNGKPLLLSSRSELRPSFESIPSCTNCLSPRVFELQLMPSLVNYLRVNKTCSTMNENVNAETVSNSDKMSEQSLFEMNDASVRIEFGCIYVFSCSKSCWNGNDFQYEFVALQPDPDVDVLK